MWVIEMFVQNYKEKDEKSYPFKDRIEQIVEEHITSLKTIEKFSGDILFEYTVKNYGYLHVFFTRYNDRVFEIYIKGPEGNRRAHLWFYLDFFSKIEKNQLIIDHGYEISHVIKENPASRSRVDVVLKEQDVEKLYDFLTLL